MSSKTKCSVEGCMGCCVLEFEVASVLFISIHFPEISPSSMIKIVDCVTLHSQGAPGDVATAE